MNTKQVITDDAFPKTGTDTQKEQETNKRNVPCTCSGCSERIFCERGIYDAHCCESFASER